MSALRPPPPGFVDLRALDVPHGAVPHGAAPPLSAPGLEAPPLRFAIAYAGVDNFAGEPMPGYGAPGAWLRPGPAEALQAARAVLAADGLGLVIFDAYRPVRATEGMWAWAQRVGQTALFDQGWIARRSRHNTGVAVDLALTTADGSPLDHGSPFDAFDDRSRWGAPVPPAAQAWRGKLRAVMIQAGFRPYDQEWWHFERPTDPPAARCDVPYGADEPEGALEVP